MVDVGGGGGVCTNHAVLSYKTPQSENVRTIMK